MKLSFFILSVLFSISTGFTQEKNIQYTAIMLTEKPPIAPDCQDTSHVDKTRTCTIDYLKEAIISNYSGNFIEEYKEKNPEYRNRLAFNIVVLQDGSVKVIKHDWAVPMEVRKKIDIAVEKIEKIQPGTYNGEIVNTHITMLYLVK